MHHYERQTCNPTAAVAGARPSSGDCVTMRQVADALNAAADDILDAVHAGDQGLRDGLNLVVNATLAYLAGQATDLRQVVAQNYDEDYRTVLSWIEVAL